jgi:hypothetical protein
MGGGNSSKMSNSRLLGENEIKNGEKQGNGKLELGTICLTVRGKMLSRRRHKVIFRERS